MTMRSHIGLSPLRRRGGCCVSVARRQGLVQPKAALRNGGPEVTAAGTTVFRRPRRNCRAAEAPSPLADSGGRHLAAMRRPGRCRQLELPKLTTLRRRGRPRRLTPREARAPRASPGFGWWCDVRDQPREVRGAGVGRCKPNVIRGGDTTTVAVRPRAPLARISPP